MSELTHYNFWLSLKVLKTEGIGDCGESGTITGYRGAVTCEECLKLIEQEKEVMV